MDRKFRLITLILIDITIIQITLFISLYPNFILIFNNSFSIIFTTTAITLYLLLGFYKNISKFFGRILIYRLTGINFISLFFVYVLFKFLDFTTPSLVSYLGIWIILNFNLTFSRLLIKDLLKKRFKLNKSVIIYGAGSAGMQLYNSLLLSKEYFVEYFVDDNPELWGRSINSKPVRSPYDLELKNVDCILIAIPSLVNYKRRKIIQRYSKSNVKVLSVPTIEELAQGRKNIDSLQEISINDILGRTLNKNDFRKLDLYYKNKVVLVTGAGGSIGSEITNQLLLLDLKLLVLLDLNEESLYKLEEKISSENYKNKNIKYFLGSANDSKLVDNILDENKVEIIIHAAAYKHVPIVEKNPLEGLKNNVFSSLNICKLSYKHKIEKVMLISSDKAVRPTNVMGASKRLAEYIFKAYSELSKENNYPTIFSIVRFGNVLGSSGSVVPKFIKQIRNGGPITITHPKMVRYFMAINEAAQLVLHSIIMSKDGDIFLLDMGEPISIKLLAEQMIKLSGLKIKTFENQNGDIEIKYVGIRDGEKLYEELLVDSNSKPTDNIHIFKSIEKSPEKDFIFEKLDQLDKSLKKDYGKSTLKILSEIVKDWEFKK